MSQNNKLINTNWIFNIDRLLYINTFVSTPVVEVLCHADPLFAKTC